MIDAWSVGLRSGSSENNVLLAGHQYFRLSGRLGVELGTCCPDFGSIAHRPGR